jgi:hypothetical protein
MELFAELIGEPSELILQFRLDTGELADTNHEGLVELELPEVAAIGSKRVCLDESIEPVVLGAGHGVTIAEAVELLGIDGEDMKPALEQSLDHSTASQLDGNSASVRLRVGMLNKGIAETVDSPGRMLDAELRHFASSGVEQTDLVEFTAVVDAGEQDIVRTHFGFTSVCEIRSTPRCRIAPVLALWAQLPTGCAPRLPRRDAGPPQALVALGPRMAFPAGWPVVT